MGYINRTSSCTKALLNSWMVLEAGLQAVNERPRASHTYSMGLRSGTIAGTPFIEYSPIRGICLPTEPCEGERYRP
ncbi:hypothetical protein TNCV_909361 [Trichonephila clavipes]|nr:hypothetical protein TNCV_909361 [Trichonephila clavipes]